ncbi:hypothetical protein G7074_00490 [Pedobacter sp. HDW13]|uniref:DUF922 domain-containing protein n=1 Tax=Pedobacter sp. HDW13 TaxID=2714940 RepID=UPI001409D7E5|nr:hypothetical protein [Pedobacter sp. HDW13]QIL37893.1 hypothetical protein G7074_00490 [Pedobacter sp. HDW13]
MRNFILLFLTLFVCKTSYGQNKVKQIHLTWDAFKNDKPLSAKFDAKTWYHLNYYYRVRGVVKNRIKLDFDVRLFLDTAESYFDFNTKYKNLRLLNHEQGHADIGFIYANKLQHTLQKHVYYKKDFTVEMKKIFDSILMQMTLENRKYDVESNYGFDNVGQNKWDNYFKLNTEK